MMLSFNLPVAYGQSTSEQSRSSTPDASARPNPQTEVASKNGTGPQAGTSQPQSAPASATPAGSGLNTNPDQGNFFRRLFKTYADDWKPLAAVAAASAPTPPFRGDPPPVSGPPFPFSEEH